ncbi:MAG: hypothetical protein LUG86_04880 [Oscillospiraceae bacterium]|nr:hypothetical protein [Oscillospiraceae bacterium]
MKHLTDEEILSLATATVEEIPYTEDERNLMEHLKTCKDCYDEFFAAVAVIDTIGSPVEYEETVEETVGSRILAVISVVKDKVSTGIDSVLQQLDQATAAISFMPAMSLATRGTGDYQVNTSRLEDVNDEKTYISFDSGSGQLFVQINTKEIGDENISVTVKYSDGSMREIPMERSGALLMGSIDNLVEGEFKVVVASAD